MIQKFLVMSGLMRSRSLSDLLLIDMAAPLRAVLGQSPLEPLSAGRLPVVLREKLGTRRPGEWIEHLIGHSDALRRQGCHYLLLDTLQDVEDQELGRIKPLLQTLAQHGIQVVVMDRERCPVLLSTLREVVSTDQYIDIYLQSLRLQSLALTQSQQDNAERARQKRQQPRRFRLPGRIFVR